MWVCSGDVVMSVNIGSFDGDEDGEVGRRYKCFGAGFEGSVLGSVCCSVNCLRNFGGLPSIFYTPIAILVNSEF